MSTRPAPASNARRSSDAVLGGEAWVVPYEPGGPVWVTATAPAIRVMDRRRSAAPAQAEPALTAR
ncbi:MAG: hypothetical protein PGN13_04445 [Patulibacter minatonensis]